ncbi:hypothetical protein AB832_07350 [Flavobacteriaceae bacterium (ex Bugula neritina AB1)]|nr:hypothetical protein AB832_07350 [Flavobacteriaceae bacterium (ex Bugula neritina AB1)]
MTDTASLSIRVDSNGVLKAEKELGKLEKQSEKTEKDVDKLGKTSDRSSGSIKKVGVAAVAARHPVGALAVVVTAVSTAMTKAISNASDYAKEISIFARMSNDTVEGFQAMAFAAEKYGITADNLADISKDVSDKLGDFIATGGGEFADFFENVAPKVGLTARQLQGLSGTDVLIAVKKAMDDANISMEEQTFYLEAIGNDASKLKPLLADNGKEARRLGDAYRSMNLGMSQIDIDILASMREQTTLASKGFSSLANNIGVAFAPIVEDVAKAINFLIGELNGLLGSPKTIDAVTESIGELDEEIQDLQKTLNHRINNRNGSNNEEAIIGGMQRSLDEMERERDRLKKQLSDLQSKQRDAIETPQIGGSGIAQAGSVTPLLTEDGAGTGVDKNAIELENQRLANEQWLLQLEQRLMSEQELINSYAEQERARVENDITDAQQKANALNLIEKNRLKELSELQKQQDAQALQNRAQMFDAMSGIAKSFAGEQSGIYRGMFAASKAYSLAEVLLNSTNAISSAWASAPFPANLPAVTATVEETGALQAAISTVSLATGTRADGGQVLAGGLYRVGERGMEGYTTNSGQQYFVPPENGHITPNHKMNGNDAPVNWTIIVNEAEAGTTASVDNEQQIITIAANRAERNLTNQLKSGGAFSKQLERSYGLNRQGAR